MPEPQNGMRSATISDLRALYRARWSREWPEPDEFLAVLWTDTKAVYLNAKGNPRVAKSAQVMREHCLDLMRECHEFEATPLITSTDPAGLARPDPTTSTQGTRR